MKKIVSNILFLALVQALWSCGPKIIKPSEKFIDPAPVVGTKVIKGEDDKVGQQWSLDLIEAKSAWEDNGSGSKSLRIALIGSGVDYNHKDLVKNIGFNSKELHGVAGKDDDGNGYVDDIAGWDIIENDGLAFDRLGHGTAQAGIIGAAHNNSFGIQGINGNISMIPIRYIDEVNKASASYLIEALEYAWKSNVDVVNLHGVNLNLSIRDSSGATVGSVSPKLQAILDKFVKSDIPIVLNAGSTGSDFSGIHADKTKAFGVLSSYPNVLVVTSCDNTNHKPIIRNFGFKHVLTCAPGEGVFSTAVNNSFGKISGSHIASAHVAGMVALLKSVQPGIQTTEIVKALVSQESGDYYQHLSYSVRGSNRINVKKFLQSF